MEDNYWSRTPEGSEAMLISLEKRRSWGRKASQAEVDELTVHERP